MYIQTKRLITGDLRNELKHCLKVMLFLCLLFCSVPPLYSQRVALRTNAVDWLTASPNLGVEFAITPRLSMELTVAASPYKLMKDIYLEQTRVQGELKYWFKSPLLHHYVGATAFYASFDAGLKTQAFYGDAYAAGLTYGYQHVLSRRWNIEYSVGAGGIHYRMARYTPGTEPPQPNETGWQWAPVKLAVAFIYVLK